MKKLVVRHILVIRFRRVGDSVLSMGLCHSLRQTFPYAQIDFVINEGIHTLYEHHPDVDRCITFNDEENHNSRLYLKKVWKTVHDTRYDVIIDGAHHSENTLVLIVLALPHALPHWHQERLWLGHPFAQSG